jgi:sialate O-acetylesterase
MCSALLLLLGSSTASSFNFSGVFGDDCVLQRDSITAVYGFAAAGASVAVSLDGGAAVSATGQPDGTWKALLPAQPAGSNHTIVATNRGAGGGATTTDITLRRVSFGDVWFCGGQSNMELPLHFTLTRNDTYAAVAAGRYEQISLLHFDHNPLPQPARVVGGDKVLTPWMRAAAALRTGALDKFAAACWYFGESLADRLEQAAAAGPNAEKVPIGLIESAFGGTMIESWLPVASQLGCANITCTANQTQHFTKDTAAACAAAATSANAKGAGSNGELFNGMVSPFVDFTLKGWLWYQVGADADDAISTNLLSACLPCRLLTGPIVFLPAWSFSLAAAWSPPGGRCT